MQLLKNVAVYFVMLVLFPDSFFSPSIAFCLACNGVSKQNCHVLLNMIS